MAHDRSFVFGAKKNWLSYSAASDFQPRHSFYVRPSVTSSPESRYAQVGVSLGYPHNFLSYLFILSFHGSNIISAYSVIRFYHLQ